MTKFQWQAQHRVQRIKAKEEFNESLKNYGPCTQRGMIRALRLLYTYDFTKKQDAFIHLFYRYKKKLSRLVAAQKLRMIHSWRPEARERGKEIMRSLVYSHNPFLDLIPKADKPWGGYLPLPVSYGSEA